MAPDLSITRLKTRLYAARHKAYIRAFSGFAPYYIVNEFPKSGGTWLALMLADALDLPFRRNQPIQFERSITHGHFLNPIGLRNVVVLWRDPRDVLVSFYYHCYFLNDRNNAPLVGVMKQCLPFADYENIQSNLPAFINFVSSTPVSPGFTWPEFARVWAHRPGTVQTSYEALRADTTGELVRITEALVGEGALSLARAMEVVEKHRFSVVKSKIESTESGRAYMPFVREGALGGWKKHFTKEAESLLQSHGYHAMMQSVGYHVAMPATGDAETQCSSQ